MVKASVIITSYNNSHNLEQCLSSLINQSYDQNLIDLEIIIVDSGSTDNSIEILKRYKNKIKVILKPKYFSRFSPAIARNIGVKNSEGDILIFSDSDCIFPKNWVKDIIDCFKNPEIDCIIGNREPDRGYGLGTFIRRYDFILYSNKFRISKPLLINERNLQKDIPFVLLSGNNFAIKKEIWNRFKGMKSIFKNPAGEDIMIEIELIKGGYNILFNPQNKIIHIHPISLIKVFKKVFPRSEAIYLLNKFSNGFVNWRHFVERGHILNLGNFFLSVLFIILILFILSLLKISSLIILPILFMVILSLMVYRINRLNKKLELILNSKEKKYRKDYKISLFQLFYFDLIHSLLKSVALINFLRCSFFRK